MMGARINLHATVIVAGAMGVLILGRSGAGKSSLALNVIEMLRAQKRFAALVADDQVWVYPAGRRLVAEAPAAIAGLVEIRGFGPSRIAHETRAILDCAVRLVPRDQVPRIMEEDRIETILGTALPCLDLIENDIVCAPRALLAWLAYQTVRDN